MGKGGEVARIFWKKVVLGKSNMELYKEGKMFAMIRFTYDNIPLWFENLYESKSISIYKFVRFSFYISISYNCT